LVKHFDQAGVVTNGIYDFKGNLLQSSRRLAREYRQTIDWSNIAAVALESETYTTSTTYDALNRPTAVTTPDQSVYRPTFNEANLLEAVDVVMRGALTATSFVADVDYDAKGRRTLIIYGDGSNVATTRYRYDPSTLRLTGLTTRRASDQALVQDLSYSYDPAGNVTRAEDGAQQTVYFNNQMAQPRRDYTYDAVYRLVVARGREHVSQAMPPETTWDDASRVRLSHPGDAQAMRPYTELYEYDPVGNLLRLIHQATDGSWTRLYAYEEPSLLEPARHSNRLTQTSVGVAPPEPHAYDAHGNTVATTHLTLMAFDFNDRLRASARQAVNNGSPETTYYVYDAAGQRIRKVTESASGARKDERIYLGGFEVFRSFGAGGNVTLERETLHVMDDKQRVALVETRTSGTDGALPHRIRYQFGDHIGSVSLELSDAGEIISYEEYFPYGSTSYQAGPNTVEVRLKRYRYTGMERDEETGFSYHGARYYAPWLARWVSCDPSGLGGGVNPYAYARLNPVILVDPEGTDGHSPEWHKYVKAARDLKAAEARLAAFKASKEYEPIRRLEAAQARLDDLRRQQAEIQKNLVAARSESRIKVQQAIDATGRYEEAAARAESAARSARRWTRILAGVQAVGHTLEAAIACPLAETGIGAVGCIHATTSLYADGQTLISGDQTPNLFHQAGSSTAKMLGASDEAANYAGMGTDMAGGFASAYAGATATSAPTGPSLSLARTSLAAESSTTESAVSTFVGTGSRSQFRATVLGIIESNPNHPLRFLLNPRGGWKRLWSRSHANLIENPDVWEAGHIMSDKLGGNRLMVQTAWENQVQGQTIERIAGAGVLDNTAIDIGGIAVARSSAQWWEDIGWLPRGSVANAKIVQ
jgi:RHS repeat-associated protein